MVPQLCWFVWKTFPWRWSLLPKKSLYIRWSKYCSNFRRANFWTFWTDFLKLENVVKQLVILKALYNNSRNYCHLKISCPKIQYHGYKIIISHGIYRYLCDKLVSGVNLVTIMTVKTFTAGALLTIVPRATIEFNNQGW